MLDTAAVALPTHANFDAALLSTRVGKYQPRALVLLTDFDQLWVSPGSTASTTPTVSPQVASKGATPSPAPDRLVLQ